MRYAEAGMKKLKAHKRSTGELSPEEAGLVEQKKKKKEIRIKTSSDVQAPPVKAEHIVGM